MSILPGDSKALLDAVHGLEPLIREHADDAERNHRLSQPVVAGLAKAGLFRMLTPQRLGGFEVPPLTFFRVVEETARIDGSTGWCLFIGGGIPIQGAFIGDAASAEIFGRDPHMIGAGAVYPFGRAVTTEGGHMVSGRWSYASGCQHSSWLSVFCHVLDGDTPRLAAAGTPEVRVAFVPTKQAVIHDTWDVSGLAGTGSHDFTIEPIFVPEAHSYRLSPDAPRGRPFRPLSISFRSGASSPCRSAPSPWVSPRAPSTPAWTSPRVEGEVVGQSCTAIGLPFRRSSARAWRCFGRLAPGFTRQWNRRGMPRYREARPPFQSGPTCFSLERMRHIPRQRSSAWCIRKPAAVRTTAAAHCSGPSVTSMRPRSMSESGRIGSRRQVGCYLGYLLHGP